MVLPTFRNGFSIEQSEQTQHLRKQGSDRYYRCLAKKGEIMKKNLAFLITAFLFISQFSSAQAVDITYGDVLETAWYAESIRYTSEHRLMNGVGNNQFDPDGFVTRAMFATILYRLDGSSEETGTVPFKDVSEGSYYESAVAWAAKNGIVGGYSSTQFGPDDNITREQLAAILYRYATKKGYNTTQKSTLEQYADANKISTFAVDGMRWAHAAGIVNGISNSALGPQSSATRSQVATMTMRFDCLRNNIADVTPEEDYVVSNPTIEKDTRAEQNGLSKPYYTVVFKDYNGTVLKKETVPAGGKAVPPGTPKRNGYLFNGWDGNTSSIHSDQTFTAQYYQEVIPNQNQTAPKDDLQATVTENAVTQPAISVARVKAEAGSKNVIVPVEIKNNPGILGVTLTLRYDASVLTLISAENGAAVSNYLTMTLPGKFESGCRFVWDGQDASGKIDQDGVLLTLCFHVADATAGVFPIDMTCAPGDVVDNNLLPVNLASNSGSISIIQKS